MIQLAVGPWRCHGGRDGGPSAVQAGLLPCSGEARHGRSMMCWRCGPRGRGAGRVPSGCGRRGRRTPVTQSSPVRLELLRVPRRRRGRPAAAGDVASLVPSSDATWAPDQLTTRHDIFRSLKDPYERVDVLCAFLKTAGRRAKVRMPLIADTGMAQIVVHVDPDDVGGHWTRPPRVLLSSWRKVPPPGPARHRAPRVGGPDPAGRGTASGGSDGEEPSGGHGAPVAWLEHYGPLRRCRPAARHSRCPARRVRPRTSLASPLLPFPGGAPAAAHPGCLS
ncbi:hypothetical protein QJS66_20180 [Kocuria rhizophila]|nr:hypothetical protein QJS66_20180 [Kocuria rhizophila]